VLNIRLTLKWIKLTCQTCTGESDW